MNEDQKEWYRQRVAAIHARVTAYDVLRRNGVELQQAGDDREEQFSCPFHGADKKPSARVYPEAEGSPSHAWCFVCQESGWDAIGLWKKFNGISFGQALHRLEREFDLQLPEMPKGLLQPPRVIEKKEAFKNLYVTCEYRLLECKKAYRYQDDLKGYLSASSVLDITKSRVDAGVWTPEKGMTVLESLLGRMLERATSCPVD